MQTMGSRIRRLRKAKDKLSQAGLGQLVGVTDATISLWESDKTAPKAKHMQALCAALDTTPEFLLEGPLAKACRTPRDRLSAKVSELKQALEPAEIDELLEYLDFFARQKQSKRQPPG